MGSGRPATATTGLLSDVQVSKDN